MRTKRTAVLDGASAFLAGMFHRIETSAVVRREQASANTTVVSAQHPVASFLTELRVLETDFHALDRVIFAVRPNIDQRKLGAIALAINGYDVLVVLGTDLQFHRSS
jgi:hypothetical protein